jgi:hypothetical protein
MPELKIYHYGKPYRDFCILSGPDRKTQNHEMESCSYDPSSKLVAQGKQLDFGATPAQIKALDALGSGDFQIVLAEDGSMTVQITKQSQEY